MGDTPPFWETTALQDMSRAQWESLCDGCARCCLHKVMDAETEELYYTHVACRLLDSNACRCTQYTERNQHVPECMVLSPENTTMLQWMPTTCAYRRLHEGKTLSWWHPLISGDPETVHLAGISVRGLTITEDEADLDALEFHIMDWLMTSPEDL